MFVNVMGGKPADSSTMGLRPFAVHNTGGHHCRSCITNGNRLLGERSKEGLLKKGGVGTLRGSSGHTVGMPKGQRHHRTFEGEASHVCMSRGRGGSRSKRKGEKSGIIIVKDSDGRGRGEIKEQRWGR
jgi:hypothetical protein